MKLRAWSRSTCALIIITNEHICRNWREMIKEVISVSIIPVSIAFCLSFWIACCDYTWALSSFPFSPLFAFIKRPPSSGSHLLLGNPLYVQGIFLGSQLMSHSLQWTSCLLSFPVSHWCLALTQFTVEEEFIADIVINLDVSTPEWSNLHEEMLLN